jgi:DNA-binding PadR family transcriptional regulator
MTIPHALMALLATTPKFGLRLKEEFEASTGSIWPLNVGQVYATLQRLERDGFVEASDAEGDVASQKLYGLTSLGKAELDSWLRTPPEASAPPRDEIVIKVMVALTVAGYDVVSVIQTHRRQVIQSMQSFTRMKKDSGDDLALELVVDAELFRLEATSRWLDTCEARLKRGARLAKSSPAAATKSDPEPTQSLLTKGRSR